jgi:DNA-binding MarR family transcriptional regulator
MLKALVGSAAAERTLLYLQNYGEGYAVGIAKTFGLSPSQVTKQLTKFESGGFLVSRSIGRTRVYYWNERNPLVDDVRKVLQNALEQLPAEEIQRYYRERRRPRRKGKPE